MRAIESDNTRQQRGDLEPTLGLTMARQYCINVCACFAISPDLFHVKVPYQTLSTSRLHHLSKFLFVRVLGVHHACLTNSN